MLLLKFGCSVATLFLAFVLAAPLAFSQTVTISGTLAGDDGKPLSAVVTANRTAPPAASGRAETGKDGSFIIRNLPAGTYSLCAAVENLGYLDSCAWAPQPFLVQAAAGQAITAVKFVVKKGAIQQVRINDPDKILSATAVPAPKQVAPHVLLGVFTSRHIFQPLQLTGKDANGSNHQGTVPLDATPASLYITGRGVQITDETGAQIGPTGKTTPVAANAVNGSGPKLITYTVRDPNKH